jgi:hypothetical protein
MSLSEDLNTAHSEAVDEAVDKASVQKCDKEILLAPDIGFCNKLRGAASHKNKKTSDRRISLTYMEKADIVRYKRKHDKLTYEELGAWCEERYGKRPSNAALCKLISKEAEQVLKYVENEGSRYNKNKSKLQKSPVDKVEKLLGIWVKEATSTDQQAPDDAAIVQRARLIGAELGVLESHSFKYSPSWLLRFKKRLGIIDATHPARGRWCPRAPAAPAYASDSDDATGRPRPARPDPGVLGAAGAAGAAGRPGPGGSCGLPSGVICGS